MYPSSVVFASPRLTRTWGYSIALSVSVPGLAHFLFWPYYGALRDHGTHTRLRRAGICGLTTALGDKPEYKTEMNEVRALQCKMTSPSRSSYSTNTFPTPTEPLSRLSNGVEQLPTI